MNNLIGRVNRLNYVFQNSLDKLISEIHFLDTIDYTTKNSNMANKIALLRDHVFTDSNKNPLLENYSISDLKLTDKDEEVRRIKDKKIVDEANFLVNSTPESLVDRIKQNFIENSINDFYKNLDSVIPIIIENASKITTKEDVILAVYEVFVKNLEPELNDYEIERLKNEKARKYYQNYLNIFQLMSLREKITNTLSYFEQKSKDEIDTFLFIGSSFGDVVRTTEAYKSNEYQQEVYINLKGKNKSELANISLIKIKIEEDFVGFKLKKLITFLYDFNYISEEMYLLCIYGSIDKELIDLTRIGLNPSVIRVLKDNAQLENIRFDENGNLVSNDNFKEFMVNQSELFNFEINKYVK